MWPILGILTVGTLIALYEIPTLLKNKHIKELYVFSVLLIFGVILSIIESLNIDIPNPSDWIAFMYKPFSDILYSILE